MPQVLFVFPVSTDVLCSPDSRGHSHLSDGWRYFQTLLFCFYCFRTDTCQHWICEFLQFSETTYCTFYFQTLMILMLLFWWSEPVWMLLFCVLFCLEKLWIFIYFYWIFKNLNLDFIWTQCNCIFLFSSQCVFCDNYFVKMISWLTSCHFPAGFICTAKFGRHQRCEPVYQWFATDSQSAGRGGHVLALRSHHQF